MNQLHYAHILELNDMKPAALRARYREVFGEPSRSGNTAWLRKRIAWRIQSQAEGSLSERAKQRAAELANEADLRTRPPRGRENLLVLPPTSANTHQSASPGRDLRLPRPGTLLSRQYKGRSIVVTVLEDSFLFEEREYQSLSAIAGEVTGTRWNGFQFFGLKKGGKHE